MSAPFCEILAPAGNEEMLRAAVYSGADAVYLGLTSFNARRSAGNFTPEALRSAVSFCHGRGVKVYVALNITVYGAELAAVQDSIAAVAAAGADAVIVQDLAVAALVRRCAPELPLHGSTQMSVHSLEGARQLADMGFARVILARELSLEEIRVIADGCGIEVECFVHGALCMSMSGQCMMSAFLGGRSGNRGSCAGPCRLPFAADGSGAAHLSLKDMSLVRHIPAMQKAGVCSAKIEGRLRTPEYVAAAVSACRAARDGQAYDAQLLRDVFSRSGFTDAYLTGKRDGAMFGVRTEADTAAARAALPRARELFRREFSRLPVDLTLTVSEDGAKLKAENDGFAAVVYLEEAPQPAQKDQAAAVERCLRKTGGTPFLAREVKLDSDGMWYLPASALNEARRAALEQLLEKRSRIVPHAFVPGLPALPARTPGARRLWARFASVSQMPEDLSALERVILPIGELDAVPEALRGRTVLELPRAMFGAVEQQVQRQLERAAGMGFAGFEANNLAHLRMAKGLSLYGGLGLNVTNPLSGAEAVRLGVQGVLALPELTAAQVGALARCVPAAAIGYGHLPLMLTRACPLHNVRTCAGCPRKGELTDRKGRRFAVRCGLGVRTIYNPVPLYMGDKPGALGCDCEVLYFTTESPRRAAQVLAIYAAGAPFDGELTRGLYFKGTD